MLRRVFSCLAFLFQLLWRPSLVVPAATVLAGVGVAFLMTGPLPSPSASALAAQPAVKARPPALDLTGGVDWLNTDKAISLNDLKGRIVLLDFWTLCCINCIHILPDLATLETRYPNVLVIIGVHSPKFDNEKKSSSILKAILRYEIKHPVVNDADRKIWKKYGANWWPTLVLIDPDGNYYGAITGENHLKIVDANIKKLIKEFTAKGTLKNTPISFKLAKETASSPLYFPGKVLADAGSNRLFIADSTDHRIVVTTLEGKKIAIAGSGVEGLKDGKFSEARFSDPQGMALDGETLYVADRKNNCLRALDLKAETVKTVAGTGEQLHVLGRVKGGAALKIPLNSPWDLLLFQKKIYIAMAGQHQIWTYDPAKQRVDPYAGDGREEIQDGTLLTSSFAQPSGLATDGKHLFVADSEISAIRSVPLPGTKAFVTTIVGKGLFAFGDQNGQGDEVRLQHALGVAYLNGKLYVADTYNSKIKLIDPVLRTCETYLGGAPGTAQAKLFSEPGGLSIADGKMYVADTNNHRIQVVDMQSKEVTTLQLQGVDPVVRETLTSKDAK